VLLVLTGTTGLVDAVSIFGLGHVFTANMTGNVVFLGFAAAGAREYSAARCALALAAFLVGATGGGALAGGMRGATLRRWLLTVAALESGLLLGAALPARGYDPARLVPAGRLATMLALTAAAMGLRNATVRKLGVADLTTTVLTLTLTGLGADSRLAGGTNPRWARRVAAVGAMFVGAALGTWLMRLAGVGAALALAALGVLAPTLAYAAHPASARPASQTTARSDDCGNPRPRATSGPDAPSGR
jgi:uncharacterized membrane protein YoaK (UPF0700 family)